MMNPILNSRVENVKLVAHQNNESGGLHIVLEYLSPNSTLIESLSHCSVKMTSFLVQAPFAWKLQNENESSLHVLFQILHFLSGFKTIHGGRIHFHFCNFQANGA